MGADAGQGRGFKRFRECSRFRRSCSAVRVAQVLGFEIGPADPVTRLKDGCAVFATIRTLGQTSTRGIAAPAFPWDSGLGTRCARCARPGTRARRPVLWTTALGDWWEPIAAHSPAVSALAPR